MEKFNTSTELSLVQHFFCELFFFFFKHSGIDENSCSLLDSGQLGAITDTLGTFLPPSFHDLSVQL